MLHTLIASRWSLVIWWIGANTVGWAATMGAFEALPRGFEPMVCVIIATAQWLALRHQGRVSPWWMAGTSLGWFAGLWASAHFSFFDIPDLLWAGGVGGALAGGLQCWTLWRRTSWPMVWAPVSIVASMAGWWVGESVALSISSLADSWLYIVGGAIGGIVIGSLSAPGLLWLLRHPKAASAVPPGRTTIDASLSEAAEQWKRFYLNPPR